MCLTGIKACAYKHTLVTSHAPQKEEEEEEEKQPVRPSVKTSQGGRQSYDLREGKANAIQRGPACMYEDETSQPQAR